MHGYVLLTAIGCASLAAPAFGRDGRVYVGADLGATTVNGADLTFVPGSLAASDGRVRLDTNIGFDGGAFLGYDIGPVRIEAEASYRSANAGDVNSDFTVGTVLVAGQRPAAGKVSALGFMGNVMLDLGDEDGMSFFVGAGAGKARIRYNDIRVSGNSSAFLDDSDWRFAWQGIAGARYAVSDKIDATLRYRFFNADNVETTGFGGRSVEGDFRSHSLLAGITFHFGGF